MTEADLPLLSPDDPPAFQHFNRAGRAPLLLLCDHAGNAVPRRLNRLGVTAKLLRDSHTAWDIGAGAVTRALAERLDAPALLGCYSRLVIDLNRPIGDPTSIPEVSDGIVIPGNQNLSDAAAERRAAELFWPYHQAISNTIAQEWRHGPAPVVVVVHSFTPQFGGQYRPWQLGILWNHDPRLSAPLLDWLRRHHPELCLGDNQPYSGREIGFTLDQHAAAAGLAHVALELRQDLIADAAGQARWAELIGTALAAVLAAAGPELHSVQHY